MHGTGEPRLKVLVCIAYYGVENEAYVEQVIDEYRSMDYDVHIVVLTERWKSIDGVEQIVGLPCSDPYSLPFAHKPIFRDRADDYDLFVYTEDDTLVRQCNIEAFLWATSVLPSDRVAGFLRTEVAPDGTRRCSSVHNHFHWDPTSALRADGEVFAEYTNPHGACYVLTREQLRVCLDSGRFMSAPHLGRYSMPRDCSDRPLHGLRPSKGDLRQSIGPLHVAAPDEQVHRSARRSIHATRDGSGCAGGDSGW